MSRRQPRYIDGRAYHRRDEPGFDGRRRCGSLSRRPLLSAERLPDSCAALKERKDDIPILIEYFVKRYADKAGKRIAKIDKNTLELCASYGWPGNMRELQNIVERSVILCTGDTFRVEQAWLTAHGAPPVRSGEAS